MSANPTKKSFLAELAQLAAGYRRQIEAEVDGFDPDPARRLERRQRALDPVAGYGFFVATYFPHYVRHPDQSELHRYLFSRLPQIVAAPGSESDAIAAPRGEAKSTLVTQLFTLWNIVTGRKHYPVIIMDSIDQAYPMLEAIKAELAFNPRLLMDFPEATGQGRVWQAGTIVTTNDVKVQVAGSGKKLRGLRHGPWRPDLAILDDIENDENVRSPEQRDKLEAWLKKTVLPLGGAGAKFDVIYIGTILHYDSVLSRTLANPLWRSARFRALLHWPDQMDLWERWEELLRNDGPEVADAFYLARQAEMDAGSVVSWTARPLLALMKIRARDGHDTFDSEYQNDPVSGDNAPFAKCIHFWVNRLAEWVFYGACDPSLGKAGSRRDPSALLVGGLNRETGILDVVEASIKKRLPDRIIEDVIAFQRDYRCLVWGVETVQFQEFFKDELVKRAAVAGIPVPARGIKPIGDKSLRIETLQPHMANGLIRLHDSQAVLIAQLRHFPMADHDDGPDALHMLWGIARSGAGRIEYTPAPRHGGGRWSGNW
ncbi:phage terminase large subunit [Laribacter hongkongensis]|uniref:Phage protein n=1 Tax=Laribacter hongkongensis TaxID=168471 RepID=A0A248LQ52_9NEIS|nr:phage terminase large subunit [Laribacter hongkongensis]ASJ26223.1 phage protein [Laribacter hongkongensis]MCG9040810.1 phage terminase large subunit [Laribacter hongkongensis]MCG9068018.1 phage terminase large subunit [Laribacter hongkongensis]MCG9090150.1 phage terminase large subunit [Laribacter hongkongensis]MCG9111066.1 phage terminase large subunit [Laribacter hongkongensis]